MKKTILFHFLILLATAVFSQSCTIVDSFNTNGVGVANTYIHPLGLAWTGSSLWVSGSTTLTNYIYNYSTSGVRQDSIAYVDNSGYSMEALAIDSNYLWGLRYQVDTLYKFNLTTKQLVAVISLGGRYGATEEFGSIANHEDTLYFIGVINGTTFKYIKSSGTFIDYPVSQYYPSAIVYVNGQLIATNASHSIAQQFLIDPVTLHDNPASYQDWCLLENMQLVFDGSNFWQTTFKNTFVYKLNSTVVSTGITAIEENVQGNIYPNPTNGKFEIQLSGFDAGKTLQMNMYDIDGALIYKKEMDRNSSLLSVDMATSALSGGLYFVELNDGQHFLRKKLVIE